MKDNLLAIALLPFSAAVFCCVLVFVVVGSLFRLTEGVME
jgi:hypothetical protein